MTETTPEPKELAISIRQECARQDESQTKLIPFVQAGWGGGPTSPHKKLECSDLYASYDNGQFGLQCSTEGETQYFTFDSAEEVIKYVAEVEQHLKVD